jgi:hypothetical protein
MFSEAWEATEELPPEDRTSEPALVIRLQILTALAQWDLGEHVASLLIHAGEESRQTVSRFHHARARCFYQSGDYDSARKEIRRAVDAWRGIQRELSDDDLNALFQE